MDGLAGFLKRYVEQDPPACGDAQAVVDKSIGPTWKATELTAKKLNSLYEDLRAQIDLPLKEYDEVLYT